MIRIDSTDDAGHIGIVTWTPPPVLAKTIEKLEPENQKKILADLTEDLEGFLGMLVLIGVSRDPVSARRAFDGAFRLFKASVVTNTTPPDVLE